MNDLISGMSWYGEIILILLKFVSKKRVMKIITT